VEATLNASPVASERLKILEHAAAAARESREALKQLAHALDGETRGVHDLDTARARVGATAATKEARAALRTLTTALEHEVNEAREMGLSVAEQRLRSVVPVTQPLMLCSQIPRSGGTLLSRLFDGHPECFAHPFELQWGKPRKWQWPDLDVSADMPADRVFEQLRERWPREFSVEGYEKSPRRTHQAEAAAPERHPFVFDAVLQRRIFVDAVERSPDRSHRRILNAYLTSLFNAWLDYQNLYRTPKRWVTAFVPRLITHRESVERFFVDYPDGILVTLVRDPAAWLSSFSPMTALDPESAVAGWITSAEASLMAHAAHPQNVIVLLFEDLVHRTEAVMRLLCERMGLGFSDTLLQPTYNSMPVLSDSSHVRARGIDAAVTERHRETLTPEQREIVERNAMPRHASIRERFGLSR